MPPLDSKYITISGQPTYQQWRPVVDASGIPGVGSSIELYSFNASFGLNDQPHRYEMEYVPTAFTNTSLPRVGTEVNFSVGSMRVAGRISHVDYNKSDKGCMHTITVEDPRKDLAIITLDTFGAFGVNDSAESMPIVDVPYLITKNGGNSDVIRKSGANYREITMAIAASTKGAAISSCLPDIDRLSEQVGGKIDDYRWQFKGVPILQAIGQICNDLALDYYWVGGSNTGAGHLQVINRKVGFEIAIGHPPLDGQGINVLSIRFGQDEGERRTSAQVLGARMEKFIGTASLLPEADSIDIGISVSLGEFKPAWRMAKVRYYTADGGTQEYTPSDRELRAALKGIEYWALEMGLENRINGQAVTLGTGRTAYQPRIAGTKNQNSNDDQPGALSKDDLGQIQNRGRPEAAWQIEWYNRIRSFAQNYFGRAYVIPAPAFFNDFEVLDAGWSNIENQSAGGTFADGYGINAKFKYLAPFWDSKSNKLRPYAIMPPGTLWGPDGKGTPAPFEEWTEESISGGKQYVPIEAKQFGGKGDDPMAESYIKFTGYSKGIMIRLPNVAWQPNSFKRTDAKLMDINCIKSYFNRFMGKVTTRDGEFVLGTSIDMLSNPASYGEEYSSIAEIGLPIRVQRRFGYGLWEANAGGGGADIATSMIDEDLAPWNYPPAGKSTSIELMNQAGMAKANGLIYNCSEATFAEITKVGPPEITFDNFANADGTIDHGVTSLSITKTTNWWQVRYNLKTHYPAMVRAKPFQEPAEEDYLFAVHAIKDKISRKIDPEPFSPVKPFEPEVNDGRSQFIKPIKNKFDVLVTITQIFTDDGFNYYYVGKDALGIEWPATMRSNFTGLSTQSIYYKYRQAFCTDGYLQQGMAAMYHYEDLDDGSFLHYFTGGVALSASRVVELMESPKLVEGVWRANVRTRVETVVDINGGTHEVQPFYLFNLPFLNQKSVDASLQKDDIVFTGSTGNFNHSIVVPNMDVQKGNTLKSGAGKDGVYIINTGAPAGMGFAVVTKVPSTTDGTGGAIQTIGAQAGEAISDGMKRKGQTFYYRVRFIGVEYDAVSIGDPCITLQEREENGDLRFYCFILKPMFMPYNAFGSGPFITTP